MQLDDSQGPNDVSAAIWAFVGAMLGTILVQWGVHLVKERRRFVRTDSLPVETLQQRDEGTCASVATPLSEAIPESDPSVSSKEEKQRQIHDAHLGEESKPNMTDNTIGYAKLYEELAYLFRQQPAWEGLSVLLLVYFAAGFIFWLLFLAALLGNVKLDLQGIVMGIIVILYSIVVFFSLPFWVYTALIGTRDPAKAVPQLAAHILTTVPCPYTNRRGLAFEEIKRLKQVAEIEQGSADWRGSFVNVVIIGAVTVIIGGSPLALKWLLETMSSDPFQGIQSLPAPPWITFLAWLLLASGLAWIFYKIFLYLWHFLGTESTNRAVLLACEEALALLKVKGLTRSTECTFSEKRALVGHFGYCLMSEKQVSRADPVSGPLIKDPSGAIWFLVPLARISKTSWLTRWRHRVASKRDFKSKGQK